MPPSTRDAYSTVHAGDACAAVSWSIAYTSKHRGVVRGMRITLMGLSSATDDPSRIAKPFPITYAFSLHSLSERQGAARWIALHYVTRSVLRSTCSDGRQRAALYPPL
jgi:hypothetical protein